MVPVAIFSHTLAWPITMTLLAVLSVYEVMHCVGIHRKIAFAVPFYAFGFLPVLTWLFDDRGVPSDRVIVGAILLLFLCEFMGILLTKNAIPGEKIYSAIALVLYAVLGFTALTMARRFPNGVFLFLLVFFGAWLSDTFAFFTGKAIGKHKLCPEISPNKTVEGAVGGVVGDAVCFALYAFVIQKAFNAPAGIWRFALLGALLSVVGQLGDLFASSVKRYYGIKDFGNILPGHGGILDRFDSILSISCTLYLVCAVFGSQFFNA